MFLYPLPMQNSCNQRTLEGFNYFSNPIAQDNGILSIFPPLEMSLGAKGLPLEGEMFVF